jgi:hypothetical protein
LQQVCMHVNQFIEERIWCDMQWAKKSQCNHVKDL